jgi:hypothetical protein
MAAPTWRLESVPENLRQRPCVERRALRRALLERRLALPTADWASYSSRVCAHLEAGFPQLATMAVGFCWPQKQEPDLRPLIEKWAYAAEKAFGRCCRWCSREPATCLSRLVARHR